MNLSSTVPSPAKEQTVQGKEVLSAEVRNIAEQIVVFSMLPLACTGIITNSINIRVFLEQGVKNDNTNIGLLSLSLFDLLTSSLQIPFCACYLLRYVPNLPKQATCIAYATIIGYPVYMLFNCSTWSTVYISLERSLCVAIPLKVKQYLTPKVTVTFIVFTVLIFLMLQTIYGASTRIIWIFHPVFNQTIAVVFDSPFAKKYLTYYSMTTNTILSSCAIVIVAVTTAIMIHKLIESKKWRQHNMGKPEAATTTTSEKKHLGSKDIELVKSVTTVTSIFLVCLSVSHIPTLTLLTLPGMSFDGINKNLFNLVYLIRILFGSVNASINFFFYVRISSRYKEAFANIFGKKSKKTT